MLNRIDIAKKSRREFRIISFTCALTTLVSVVLFFAIGCNTTSSERIALIKSGIDKAAVLSEEIDKYCVVLDSQLAEADRILADPATGIEQGDRIREVIAKIKAEKDKAQAKKIEIDAAIAKAKTEIERITAEGAGDLGTELQTIGTLLTTTAPLIPPPAGGYMALVGALLTAIGGAIGGKAYQSIKDAKYKTATEEIILGNEKSLKVLDNDVADMVKNIWMASQVTPTTRKLVKKFTTAA
jgi:F0F1-type ATP synthase membrane subunit b/b'